MKLEKGDAGLIFGIVFNMAINAWTAYAPIKSAGPWANAALAVLQCMAIIAFTYQFAWHRGYKHDFRMQQLYKRYEGARQ